MEIERERGRRSRGQRNKSGKENKKTNPSKGASYKRIKKNKGNDVARCICKGEGPC
jgi:hypothetical protein